MVESVPTDDQPDDAGGGDSVIRLENDDEKEANCPSTASNPDAMSDDSSTHSTTTFTYTVDQYSRLGPYETKIYSEYFTCDDIRFRVLLFPHGNYQPRQRRTHMAVYIEIDQNEFEKHLHGWAAYTQFEIVVKNIRRENESVFHSSQHHFNTHVSDQGFAEAIALEKLRNPIHGFLNEDGSIVIVVKMKLLREHSPSSYRYLDSKKSTGFVGLKNQGATCYMNSFLQTLYNIPFFRKAVYSLPTEKLEDIDPGPVVYSSKIKKVNESIPLALQRVFHDLQFNDKPVGTKHLTKSFGWESSEAFQQHDVQEFSRVLCDVLDRQMAKTEAEDTITQMFEAKYEMFVECINVNYKSSRVETYHDLSLTVKGCSNVMKSLRQYIELETLDGDNLYRTEQFGMQPAKKGILFHSFPPVLQLQLKRFEYDAVTRHMVKVNDRFEFPLTLDLNELIMARGDRDEQKFGEGEKQGGSPKSEAAAKAESKKEKELDDYTYELHSVLVHSGNVYGGHYQVFIRPQCKDAEWFRFDDDQVIRTTNHEALDDNFGGDDEKYIWKDYRMKKNSSAYMLVYVQKNKISKFLSPIVDDDVPQHLIDRFQREIMQYAEAEKQQEEEKKKKTIRILTEKNLQSYHGCELGDGRQWEIFKVYKKDCLVDLKDAVQKRLNIPLERQQYWFYTKRHNNTYRPNRKVPKVSETLSFNDLANERFFLRDCSPDFSEKYPDSRFAEKNAKIKLLFFKWFDAEKRILQNCGSKMATSSDLLSDVVEQFRELMSFPKNKRFLVYEEEHALKERVFILDQSQTLASLSFVSGDILCFEFDTSAEKALELPEPSATISPVEVDASTMAASATPTTTAATPTTTAATPTATEAAAASSESNGVSIHVEDEEDVDMDDVSEFSKPSLLMNGNGDDSRTNGDGGDDDKEDDVLSLDEDVEMKDEGFDLDALDGMDGLDGLDEENKDEKQQQQQQPPGSSTPPGDPTDDTTPPSSPLPHFVVEDSYIHDPCRFPHTGDLVEHIAYIQSYVTVYFYPRTPEDRMKITQSLAALQSLSTDGREEGEKEEGDAMDTSPSISSLPSPTMTACELHRRTRNPLSKPPIDPKFYCPSQSSLSRQIDYARSHFHSCDGKFTLVLSRHTRMRPLRKLLSLIFNMPENRICLYPRRRYGYKDAEMHPCEASATTELDTFVVRFDPDAWVLYYEAMKYTYEELESNVVVPINWRRPGEYKSLHPLEFLVPESATIADLLEIVGTKLVDDKKICEADINRLRVVSIVDQLRCQPFEFSDPISRLSRKPALSQNVVNCVELGTDKDVEKSEDDIVFVFWSARHELTDWLSVLYYPFLFVVKKGETMAQLKPRLKELLGTTDREFSKLKFWKLERAGFLSSNDEVKDGDVVSDLITSWNFRPPTICIVHEASKKRKPSLMALYEQPSLKIKG